MSHLFTGCPNKIAFPRHNGSAFRTVYPFGVSCVKVVPPRSASCSLLRLRTSSLRFESVRHQNDQKCRRFAMASSRDEAAMKPWRIGSAGRDDGEPLVMGIKGVCSTAPGVQRCP